MNRQYCNCVQLIATSLLLLVLIFQGHKSWAGIDPDDAEALRGITEYNSEGNAVSVDALGNTYTTGYFEGTLKIGTTTQSSNGGKDIFVCKHDPNGVLLWMNVYGSEQDDAGIDVLTLDGNVYITGYYKADIQLDPNNPTPISHQGEQDAFVLKLDPSNGNFIWVELLKGLGNAHIAKLAGEATISGTVRVYMAGYIGNETSSNHSAYFQSTANTLTAGTKRDVFLGGLEDLGSSFQVIIQEIISGSDDVYATSLCIYDASSTARIGYPAWASGSIVVVGNMKSVQNLSIDFQTNNNYPSQIAQTACSTGACSGYEGFITEYAVGNASLSISPRCFTALCLNNQYPASFGVETEIEDVISSFDNQAQGGMAICGYYKDVGAEGPFFAEIYSFGSQGVGVVKMIGNSPESRAKAIDVAVAQYSSPYATFYMVGNFKGTIDADQDGNIDYASNNNSLQGFRWYLGEDINPPIQYNFFEPLNGQGNSVLNDIYVHNHYFSGSEDVSFTGGFRNHLELGPGVQEVNEHHLGDYNYLVVAEDWQQGNFNQAHHNVASYQTWHDVEFISGCVTSPYGTFPNGTEYLYSIASFDEVVNLGTGNLSKANGTTFLMKLEVQDLDHNVDGKLDPIWYRQYAGTTTELKSVVCDQDDNVFVMGSFSGTQILGDGTTSYTALGIDAFVDKFDQNGNHQWTFHINGNGDDLLNHIELWDNQSSLLLAGAHQQAINSNGLVLAGPGTSGNDHGFMASISAGSSPTVEWSRSCYDAQSDNSSIWDVAVKEFYRDGNLVNYITSVIQFKGETGIDPNGTIKSPDNGAEQGFMLFNIATDNKTSLGDYAYNRYMVEDYEFPSSNNFQYTSTATIKDLVISHADDALIVATLFNGDIALSIGGLTSDVTNDDIGLVKFQMTGMETNGGLFTAADYEVLSLSAGTGKLHLQTSSTVSFLSFTLENGSVLYPDPANGATQVTGLGKDVLVTAYNTDLDFVPSYSLISSTGSGDQVLTDFVIRPKEGFALFGSFTDEYEWKSGVFLDGDLVKTSGFLAAYQNLCSPLPTNPSVTPLDICHGLKQDLTDLVNNQTSTTNRFYWYEDINGTPGTVPINNFVDQPSLQLVNEGDVFWMETINEFGCPASKQQVSTNNIGQKVSILSPSSTVLCSSSGLSTINLDHSVPSGGWAANTTITWEEYIQQGASKQWVEVAGYNNVTVDAVNPKVVLPVTTSGEYRIKLNDAGCYGGSGSYYSAKIVITSSADMDIAIDNFLRGVNLGQACPWKNEYVDLDLAPAANHTYSWEKEVNGSYVDLSTLYSGANNVDDYELNDVVTEHLDPSEERIDFRCRITRAFSGGGTCELITRSVTVAKHPTLTLGFDNLGANNAITSSTVSLNTSYLQRAFVDFPVPEFYLNGQYLCTHTTQQGGAPPQAFDYRHSTGTNSIISKAVSLGNLDQNRDYPGVYELKSLPMCDLDPANKQTSNTVRLTVDCSGLTNYTSLSSSTINSVVSYSSGSKVKVSGTITVASGGVLTFTASDIMAGAGAEIIVNSGGKLVLESTSTGRTALMACDSWKGITVNGTGELEVTGNSGHKVLLSGANIAILSSGGGLVTVDHATFENNFNDVAIVDHSSGSNGSAITNSKFRSRFYDCSGGCSFRYSLSNFNGVDQGNLIYLKDVAGVTLQNNDFDSPSDLGFEFDAYPIRAYGVDDLSIESCYFQDEWITGMYFENCSNVSVSSTDFDGDISAMSYALYSENTQGFSLDNCVFDGSINGAFFNDGNDLTVEECSFFNHRNAIQNTTSIGLEVYSEGANMVIRYNDFYSNEFGLVVSPEENPLTGSAANNYGTTPGNPKILNLTLECNKFHENNFGIVGSGTVFNNNTFGSTVLDAGNIFYDINAPGTGPSSNFEWDILWASDAGTTLTYYYLPSTPPTCMGYLPNSAGPLSLMSLMLNGATIGTSNNGMTFSAAACNPNTCYGTWKTDHSTDAAEVKAAAAHSVQIYPNPSIAVLNIESTSEQLHFKVISADGKVVYESNGFGNMLNQISTENLLDGVYFVKVVTVHGAHTMPFVKQ